MKRFNLYLTIGNPGSGKTTAARKLAERFDVSLLDPDLMRRELGLRDYDPKDTPRVMGEIFRRKIAALNSGQIVVLATPYVRIQSREQSYRLITDISSQLAQDLTAVIISCECPEELAKCRIQRRASGDGLHCATNDPRKWDNINAQKNPISKEERAANPLFSYLEYNTEEQIIRRLAVRSGMEEAVDEIEALLL
ncbi:hypothetical protein COV82_04890 [Candidatus Peregrinibacteria bacterium CG11_big_fil_rev_8_21_14_0_20_46_8]|nr:MAG: hypothetical protein COV82_04890 [Candidatus Peregrinibacteria bacterium CG11_big_fil_rev_8_21_14_0_20_46_8]